MLQELHRGIVLLMLYIGEAQLHDLGIQPNLLVLFLLLSNFVLAQLPIALLAVVSTLTTHECVRTMSPGPEAGSHLLYIGGRFHINFACYGV